MARNPNPTTRLYQIKPGKSGWARIWITDDGSFTCISDYGNYGYWWGDPGCEFRKFLISCDSDYLSGKFSGGAREYDGERTIQIIREKILYQRRHGQVSRAVARVEWDRCRKADDERGYEVWQEEIEREMQGARGTERRELHDLFSDAWDFASYGPPSRVRHFLKNVWPSFIEQLRAELAQEPKTA